MGDGGHNRWSVEDLTVAVIDALDDAGINHTDIQLGAYVDLEALAAVLDSLEGEYAVTFAVDGVVVEITDDGITVSEPTADGA